MARSPGRAFVVVVVDEVAGYQLHLLEGIEEVLGDLPVLVTVSNALSGHATSALSGLMHNGWVGGLIMTALQQVEVEREICARATAAGIPAVSISRRIDGVANVECDNAAGMRQLMTHLLDQCGVTTPILVTAGSENEDANQRHGVVAAELARRGRSLDTSLVVNGRFHREDAFRQVSAVLEGRRDIDAVVALNDDMAYGAVEALRLHGFEVPGQVRVAGFDDLPASAPQGWDLTSVSQDLPQQGREAARALLCLAEGGSVPPNTVVSSQLVVRGTTAPDQASPDTTSDPDTGTGQVVTRAHRDTLAGLNHLLEISRSFAGCTSLDEVVNELVAHLPRLGLRTCFLVLPEESEGTPGRARMALAFVHGRAQPLTAGSFAPADLLPVHLLPHLGRRMVMQALSSGARQHGYLLYESSGADDRSRTSDVLQIDLTRALDTILRERQLQQHTDELERLVALRTQQLELEVSIRRRAEQDLRRANADLERVTLVDELTGIANRRALNEGLRRGWERAGRGARPIGVVLCDVDLFKQYNDRYGHPAGDECLRLIAIALAEAVGRPDDLVTRFGGEEFAILLPFTDEAGVAYLAERLVESVRALEIPHDGSPRGRVTISAGWAVAHPAPGDSADRLIGAADIALYDAKAAGRDRVEWAAVQTRNTQDAVTPDYS